MTARIDGVRSHRVKQVEDIKEVDRRAERAIAGELERRQQEVEDILKKKKEEEHLKRLEFEEQRIKEENEKMKKDAEEKRKRDWDDSRIQEMTKSQEGVVETPAPTPAAEGKVGETEEERRLKEEELMIKLGREEHFKELGKRWKAAEVQQSPPTPPSAPRSPRPTPKPAPIRQAPIGEYLRPAPSLTPSQQGKGGRSDPAQPATSRPSPAHPPRTLAVVEDREKDFSSFNVFQVNKQMQRPRYQTLAEQGRPSPSSSRRWEGVSTGLVRDRATAYLATPQPSPRLPRRTLGAEAEEVAWRREGEQGSRGEGAPALALLGVAVEKGGQSTSSKVPEQKCTMGKGEPSPLEKSPVEKRGLSPLEKSPMDQRGPSPLGTPAARKSVADLSLTMAELQSMGARGEQVPPCTSTPTPPPHTPSHLPQVCAVTSASSSVSQAALSVRDAAKGVREVAQCLLSTISPSREVVDREEWEERREGEEEWEGRNPGEVTDEEEDYEEEHSVGIDLPQGPDPTSGEEA